MKKLKLLGLLLALLSLSSCNQQKHVDSFARFCDYYDNYHINCYIESTTGHKENDLRVVEKKLMAKSDFLRGGHYFLYAKLDVSYLSGDEFYNLKWLVEYEYSEDFSYQNTVCFKEELL